MAKKQFLSFVFPETTKKQIDSMPTVEMKFKFYEAVTNYGMYGIEPEGLNEIENLIWIPMKDLLDNSRSSKGGAPKGNQNARKSKASESEEDVETTDNIEESEENNLNNIDLEKTTETNEKQLKQPKNNKTTLNNHNHNHNGNHKCKCNGENNTHTKPPTLEEVKDFVNKNNLVINPEKFILNYNAYGWDKISDWKEACKFWDLQDREKYKQQSPPENERKPIFAN